MNSLKFPEAALAAAVVVLAEVLVAVVAEAVSPGSLLLRQGWDPVRNRAGQLWLTFISVWGLNATLAGCRSGSLRQASRALRSSGASFEPHSPSRHKHSVQLFPRTFQLLPTMRLLHQRITNRRHDGARLLLCHLPRHLPRVGIRQRPPLWQQQQVELNLGHDGIHRQRQFLFPPHQLPPDSPLLHQGNDPDGMSHEPYLIYFISRQPA